VCFCSFAVVIPSDTPSDNHISIIPLRSVTCFWTNKFFLCALQPLRGSYSGSTQFTSHLLSDFDRTSHASTQHLSCPISGTPLRQTKLPYQSCAATTPTLTLAATPTRSSLRSAPRLRFSRGRATEAKFGRASIWNTTARTALLEQMRASQTDPVARRRENLRQALARKLLVARVQ